MENCFASFPSLMSKDSMAIERELKVVELEDLKEYDLKLSVINTKLGFYTCTCGHHDKFKNYYNAEAFVCPNCGNSIFIVKNVVKRSPISHFDLYNKLEYESMLRLKLYKEDSIKFAHLNSNEYMQCPSKFVEFLGTDGNIKAEYIDKCTNKDNFYFKVYTYDLKFYDSCKVLVVQKPVLFYIDNVDFEMHNLKDKSYTLPYETEKLAYTHVKSLIRCQLKYPLKDEGTYYSDTKKYLKLLSSKAVYQIINNNLLYVINENLLMRKINLDETNLEKILNLPKSLCDYIRGNNSNINYLSNIEYLKLFYSSLNKELNNGKILTLDKLRQLISASNEVLLFMEEQRIRDEELINKVKGTVEGGYGDIAPYNNTYSYSLLCDYKFTDIFNRLLALIGRGYDLESLVEYTKSAYEKQGLDASELLLQLDDYSRMCYSMELKYDKYPKSVKLLHDLTLVKYKIVESVMKDKEIADVSKKHRKLECSVGDYLFILPQSGKDFIKEGNVLRHCVLSYIGKYTSESSIIIFVREKDKPNKPFVTVEVSNGVICQCKAFSDKKPSSEVLNTIKQWGKKFGIDYYRW